MTEVRVPGYILDRSFDDGSAILINKDLKVALEAALEMSFPTLIGSTIARIWHDAVAQGNGVRNHAEIYAFLKEITGCRDAGSKMP